MMQYGHAHIGLTKYVAKIGYTNTASLRLFRRLGFSSVSRSDVFQEETLEMDWSSRVDASWPAIHLGKYWGA